jgi:hypothetical protein
MRRHHYDTPYDKRNRDAVAGKMRGPLCITRPERMGNRDGETRCQSQGSADYERIHRADISDGGESIRTDESPDEDIVNKMIIILQQ